MALPHSLSFLGNSTPFAEQPFAFPNLRRQASRFSRVTSCGRMSPSGWTAFISLGVSRRQRLWALGGFGWRRWAEATAASGRKALGISGYAGSCRGSAALSTGRRHCVGSVALLETAAAKGRSLLARAARERLWKSFECSE